MAEEPWGLTSQDRTYEGSALIASFPSGAHRSIIANTKAAPGHSLRRRTRRDALEMSTYTGRLPSSTKRPISSFCML